jgi:hypothetical protein
MRNRKLAGLLVVLGLFAAQAHAAQPVEPETHRGSKLWKFSVALLGAVTVADMQSSVGRQEANPLLTSQNGQFTGQSMAIKGLIVGGVVGAQWLLLRRHPEASKYAAGANFAAAAVTGAVVVHNHMIK